MLVLKLSNIVNDVNRVLLPVLCFGCNARLSRGETFLCTLCRTQIPLTEYTWSKENTVDRTFYGRVRIEKASALLYFRERGLVKNIVHALKYKKHKKIAYILGDWMGSLLVEQGLRHHFSSVVPVPLHATKLRKRGFNQAALFGRQLALQLEAEFLPDCLCRTRAGDTQTRKDRLQRWEDQQGLYRVLKREPHPGSHILLVDDVMTTGATLEACATALKAAFDTRISIAIMAVVP